MHLTHTHTHTHTRARARACMPAHQYREIETGSWNMAYSRFLERYVLEVTQISRSTLAEDNFSILPPPPNPPPPPPHQTHNNNNNRINNYNKAHFCFTVSLTACNGTEHASILISLDDEISLATKCLRWYILCCCLLGVIYDVIMPIEVYGF